MTIDAKNHLLDVEPIELILSPEKDLSPKDPTLDWNLYCNDYNAENDALVKECQGLLENRGSIDNENDSGGDNNEDSENNNEEDEFKDWSEISREYTNWENEGDSSTSAWSPEITNQKSGFEQERIINQEQVRTVIITEEEEGAGEVRNRDERENRVKQTTENRQINVAISNWENVGAPYNCFDSTCKQDQERELEYSISTGEVLKTTKDNQTISVPFEESGEWEEVSRQVTQTCTDWLPDPSEIPKGDDFIQYRTCENTITTVSDYIVGGVVTDTKTDVTESSYTSERDAVGTYVPVPDCRGKSVIFSSAPHYSMLRTGYGRIIFGETNVLYIWGDLEFSEIAAHGDNALEYEGYYYWGRGHLSVGYWLNPNPYVNGHYREKEICRLPASDYQAYLNRYEN